ncbi:S100 calcium binding protein P [Phyllostomus discolor]|uniref:S100 calcium binding protein P n=1 Tax=Phyllostomus discolor TaxID=89673 RepID=A0A834A5V7_9CHIR|nr:S100 calcium binding protein P [Phyllostomus discolor]
MIGEVFARYGGTDSNKQSLSKGELKVLLEKELLGFLQSARDKDAMDKLLEDLDANGDSTVDSNEFTVCVAATTSACHL